MISEKVRNGIAALFAAPVVLLIAYAAVQYNSEQARKDNMPHIVKQSAALFKQITLLPEPETFSTSQLEMRASSGASTYVVVVEMGRERSKTGLVLNWNRETSELVSVRHSGSELASKTLPIMSKEQAAHTSEEWLRILGISGLSAQWKLASDPVHHDKNTVQGNYTVNWSAPGRKVEITLQHRTGDLVEMKNRTLAL